MRRPHISVPSRDSQLCGALECCLASLEGTPEARLSQSEVQHLLTAATEALRLLPLLLGQLQQQEAGAEEPAEAMAAAARQAARRCLQTAVLAGSLLFSYTAQQINNGCMAHTESEPSQFIVRMLQLQFAAALPLRAQVLELHTTVCRLLAWQRSAGGQSDTRWAGSTWQEVWPMLCALSAQSFEDPDPCYPGAIRQGTLAVWPGCG